MKTLKLLYILLAGVLMLPLASCGNDEPAASDNPFADLSSFEKASDDCVFTATVSVFADDGRYVCGDITDMEFLPSSPFNENKDGYRGPDYRDFVGFRRSDIPNQVFSADGPTEVRFKIKGWKPCDFFNHQGGGFDTCDHEHYCLIVEPA